MRKRDPRFEGLPQSAEKYIRSVVTRIRMSLKVRREVCDELIDHFVHGLRDCDDADRDKRAQELIEQFGSAKLLARLISRGKKRCRPLWKKTIIRSLQAAGLLLILCCLYTWYLTTGEPTISVDYLSMINQRRRPAVPDDQNAWGHYEKAIELYVEPPKDIEDLAELRGKDGNITKFAELDPPQQAAIRKWVKDNKPAWGELEAGSRKPHYWLDYSAEGPDQPLLMEVLLPPFGRLRGVARTGIWRSQLSIQESRFTEATDQCLVVSRVGRHLWSCRGCLIEQLIGMGLSTIANEGILRIAASERVPKLKLARAHDKLVALYPEDHPVVDLTFEQFGFLDTVQHHFTEGGPRGGHLIPGKVAGLAELLAHINDEGLQLRLILGGIALAGRDENVARGNTYCQRMNEIVKLSPYQRRARDLDGYSDLYLSSLSEFRFPFMRMFLPSFSRAGELTHQVKALHEATIAVLALRRWQIDKGEYPETLDQLIDTGYLKVLPSDPYSDGPLRYERRGDDFVLYSVGEDFTDDGGVRHLKYAWGNRLSGLDGKRKGGDRVFWPLR
jgi:hypothetical protein